MSRTLLRVIAQRRPASLLTQEAPPRAELDAVLRAVAGPRYDERPTGWRAVITNPASAPELAAAMAGMTSVPVLTGPVPRLKGQKIRRIAAYRGCLQWACSGGVCIALIFRHDPEAPLPRKVQRADIHALRGLLETTLYAQGWATSFSRRKPHDPRVIERFYDLSEHEEILGWLFVGRAAADSVPARAINLPPRELSIEYR